MATTLIPPLLLSSVLSTALPVGASVVIATTVGFGVGGAADDGLGVEMGVVAAATGAAVVGGGFVGWGVWGVIGTGVGGALVTQIPGAISMRFGSVGATTIVPVPPSSFRSMSSSSLLLSFFFLSGDANKGRRRRCEWHCMERTNAVEERSLHLDLTFLVLHQSTWRGVTSQRSSTRHGSIRSGSICDSRS